MATPAEQSAQKSGTSGKRKRYVRTEAGARRYRVPVGAEIGSARSADHAAIQKDQGARSNYEQLVGNPAKQREILGKMSDADLDKLADIAFSFKSSNQNVVALRIAARNEQSRRGRKIKPGQTKSAGGSGTSGGYDRSKQTMNYGNAKAMARTDSAKLVELVRARTKKAENPELARLRAVVANIDKAEERHQVPIALHAIGLARRLNAEHVLSDRVIELAGKWKHGFIPLDGVALNEKMKGRTGGKKWWAGGNDGVSAKKPSGSPKSGSGERTSVVKSGSAGSTTRGAAVPKSNKAPNSPFTRATLIKRAKEAGLSQDAAEKWADNPERRMLIGNKEIPDAKKVDGMTPAERGHARMQERIRKGEVTPPKIGPAKKPTGFARRELLESLSPEERRKIGEANRKHDFAEAKRIGDAARASRAEMLRKDPSGESIKKLRKGELNNEQRAFVRKELGIDKRDPEVEAWQKQHNANAEIAQQKRVAELKARHKTGAPIVAKVPGRLGTVNATVEGYTPDGKVKVSYYAGDGKGNMGAKHTAEVAQNMTKPRQSQTARRAPAKKDPLVGNMAPKFGPTRPDPEGEKRPKVTTESLRRGAKPLGPKPASTRTPSLASVKDPNAGRGVLERPGALAKRYVDKHGKEAAWRLIDKMEAKPNPSSRDMHIIGALKAWAGSR